MSKRIEKYPAMIPSYAIPIDDSWLSRFWSKVEKTDSCWNWLGAKLSDGYAHFKIQGQPNLKVHRVSYTLAKGEIPTGLVIDHLCKNRSCVNPDHLEAVTCQENTLRGESFAAKNAKKTHCNSGHEFTEENTYLLEQPDEV